MKMFSMQLVRGTAVSILVLGMGAGAAYADDTMSLGHKTQQDAKAAVATDLPEMSAEMDADLLVIHHQYIDAVEAFRRIKPQTAEIYNKIGMAYEHMQNDEDAQSYYMRAVKADGKFADAYNNLGTVYYRQKDYRQAESMYRKAIKLHNRNASYFSNLGTLYIAKGRYRDAAEEFQRAFLLDANIFQEVSLRGIRDPGSEDDLAKMNFCFAEIYAQAGMKTQAVVYLEKAVALGFRDKEGLAQNPEFASLHDMPEFQQLVANHPR